MPPPNTTHSAEMPIVAPQERYKLLAPLCYSGLKRTLSPTSAIYDRQLRNARTESTRGTEDLTSTCICLIGVDRSLIDSSRISLSPDRTLDAAIRLFNRRKYRGAFGLLTWANAVLNGVGLHELAHRAGVSLSDGRSYAAPLTTMETAWLASGLLHELGRTSSAHTQALAEAVISTLYDRFNQTTGLMAHAAAKSPIAHRIRQRIANFADQIYTVQALAFAAIALGDQRALECATSIAKRLVALQGPLGQWWWHYDSTTGSVAESYPVYSVHQHAMAPMALMAVQAAGGPDFSEAIAKSHAWLRKNELGADMIDLELETIWRDIERVEGRTVSVFYKSLALAGQYRTGGGHGRIKLKLNYETRPYEWAWCLYAGAIENKLARRMHLV